MFTDLRLFKVLTGVVFNGHWYAAVRITNVVIAENISGLRHTTLYFKTRCLLSAA